MRWGLVAVLLTLAVPATAQASGPALLAPPGDSAVSQYLETVPTDRGRAVPGVESPPRADGSVTGRGARTLRSDGPGPLTRGEQATLVHLGADGRMLGTIVEATAPTSAPVRGVVTSGSPAGPDAGVTRDGLMRRSASQPAGGSAEVSVGHLRRTAPTAASLVLTAALWRGTGVTGLLVPAAILLAVVALAGTRFARRRPRGS